MRNALNKKRRRLLNCSLYALMSPIGFLVGWYAATEQWGLIILLIGVTMALEFVVSYTYVDVIGDRFETAFEKTAADPACDRR